MKPLFIAVIFILISFVAPVQAHVLETDGDVGAVIHIDPNDDPIIGQPATFYFEFKDRSGKLNLKECSCKARILQNGTELFTTNLISSEDSLESPSISFIFPEQAVYTVEVSGSSPTNTFQSFTLSYDIRVDKTNEQTQKGSAFPPYLIHGVLIAAILIIFVAIVRRNH